MGGLVTCTCPYHENSVLSCDDNVFCRRPSASCLPVSEWASRIFQEIQDYIYRNCWTDSIMSCVSSARKWDTLLSDLEQYKAPVVGKVFCLRTTQESKCWRLQWNMNPPRSGHQKHFHWSRS